ncbi:hypothetical protein CR513_27039, partial [Mucuna pruriens]
MKVRLVTLKFSDYARMWWNQVLGDIRRMRRASCESWAELKRLMRVKFVPSYYIRDLYNKLQRLYQGAKSVEKYLSRKPYPSSSWKGKERDMLKKDKSPKKGSEPFIRHH